jgi:hypothetical protein
MTDQIIQPKFAFNIGQRVSLKHAWPTGIITARVEYVDENKYYVDTDPNDKDAPGDWFTAEHITAIPD